MTRKTSLTAAVGAALLGLTLTTQANTLRPTSAEVQDQIRIMETSITDSSVTARYDDTQRQAKLDLLERARTQAAQGNQTTRWFSSNRLVACSTRWSAATASR